MKEDEAISSPASWFLYILECSDGSLYTGVTKNIERRLAQHNAGTASKYTRVRRPVTLKYIEECGTRAQALVRECGVKELPRSDKLDLINNNHLPIYPFI